MAAYASAADLTARKDVRNLGDLASDDGVRVASGSLTGNAKITAALEDASGLIEAALLQGKRYSVADLTALTGNSASYLKRLTCDIAFWMLWDRKPSHKPDDHGRVSAYEDYHKALEMLRKGQHIFDIDEVKEAGLPDIQTPTLQQYNNRNSIVSQARGSFYPPYRVPIIG